MDLVCCEYHLTCSVRWLRWQHMVGSVRLMGCIRHAVLIRVSEFRWESILKNVGVENIL